MIRVIGYGNPLCGDDGVGVEVARRVAPRLPAGVEALEGGVGGLATLGWFEGCERVVVVDALRADVACGEVRRFRWRFDRPVEDRRIHACDLETVLSALPVVSGPADLPEVIVVGVGIEVARTRCLGLSAAVDRGADAAVEVVLGACIGPQAGRREPLLRPTG